MIDSLLISQGVLAGMTVAIRLSFFALVLLLVSLFLWRFSRRSIRYQRLLKSFALVLSIFGILLLVALALPFTGIFDSNKSYTFKIDLTDQKSIDIFSPKECRKSPIGESVSYDCIFEGSIALNLAFSDSRQISGNGRLFWVVGDKEKIHSITFFSEPLSYEQVVDGAKYLIAKWHLPDRFLLAWQEIVSSGKIETLRHYSKPLNPVPDPQIEFSIIPIDSKPGSWFISYKFYWPRD